MSFCMCVWVVLSVMQKYSSYCRLWSWKAEKHWNISLPLVHTCIWEMSQPTVLDRVPMARDTVRPGIKEAGPSAVYAPPLEWAQSPAHHPASPLLYWGLRGGKEVRIELALPKSSPGSQPGVSSEMSGEEVCRWWGPPLITVNHRAACHLQASLVMEATLGTLPMLCFLTLHFRLLWSLGLG